MAPSRGLMLLRYSGLRSKEYSTRCHSTFAQIVTEAARKTQVYVSRTLDPYVNLSIEHFLLQKSPPDSTILFLYTNRPCIVIGRNQNPWVEANLGLLNDKLKDLGTPNVGTVSLVRRRSGGGTVFHDEGNVNYSVICPTAAFDRDKHAQMVVRALHQLGVRRAKVNERHDIILDRDSGKIQSFKSTSMPSNTVSSQADCKPLKVSGSAYKLTRLRSLHHGTCLLSSPNIHQISQYLRSPAKPYIKARGVDSVSSPITNVNVSNEAFEKGVIAQFGQMYDSVEPFILTEDAGEIPEVGKGLAEIKSLEWTYMQTPQFTFSSYKSDDDTHERLPLPDYFPPGVSCSVNEEYASYWYVNIGQMALSFTARNGTIIAAELAVGGKGDSPLENPTYLDTSIMMQKRIHTINDWQEVIPEPFVDDKYSLSRWVNELFGTGLRRE